MIEGVTIMRSFHLEIATPDGTCFVGEAESILIHTDDGDVEILAGHADFLASIATGRARILVDGKARYASASGGFISVNRDGVKIAAITFEFADQIDEKRAEAAKERAEAAIAAAKDAKSIELAKAKLQRALNRINVAGMK